MFDSLCRCYEASPKQISLLLSYLLRGLWMKTERPNSKKRIHIVLIKSSFTRFTCSARNWHVDCRIEILWNLKWVFSMNQRGTIFRLISKGEPRCFIFLNGLQSNQRLLHCCTFQKKSFPRRKWQRFNSVWLWWFFLSCYKNKSLSFLLCVKNGIGQWHPIKIIFQFESLKIWKQQWKSHKKSDLKWAKLWSTLEKLKPRPEVKKLVENRFGSNFLFLLQTHFSIDDIFSNPFISCSF